MLLNGDGNILGVYSQRETESPLGGRSALSLHSAEPFEVVVPTPSIQSETSKWLANFDLFGITILQGMNHMATKPAVFWAFIAYQASVRCSRCWYASPVICDLVM